MWSICWRLWLLLPFFLGAIVFGFLDRWWFALACVVGFITVVLVMETCYKAFRTAILRNIDLREDRFGFEPEITAKVARARCRIYEVGISYDGRTYEEGKKITWRDGIRAFYAIIRYNFFARKPASVFSNENSVGESPDTVGLGPRLKHS